MVVGLDIISPFNSSVDFVSSKLDRIISFNLFAVEPLVDERCKCRTCIAMTTRKARTGEKWEDP